MRNLRILALVVAVAFLVAIGRVVRLDNGGPAHNDIELAGGEPATLYLPGAGYPFYQMFPKPQAERPPAVVLVHGFSGDRQIMSVLARRITENGYAVLAIDVHGHGANRNPFVNDFVAGGAIDHDIKQAVDFLRDYKFVDGSRIVVMGHSMGAGAVLDYSTHDPALKGTVMISGGWRMAGLERPKNALFIFAQHDPKEAIQDTSQAIAAHLANVEKIELGKPYGNFQNGDAVEAVQIPGVDHVQIIYSPEAATTIIKWLDSAFGVSRTGPIDTADPRRAATGIAMVLFLILLVPLGRAIGSMAPMWELRPAGGEAWGGLAIVSAGLFIAMPLAAISPPLSFLSLVVGDAQTSLFAVAGLILIASLTFTNNLDWFRVREGSKGVLFAAAIGFAAVYVANLPMAVTFHRLSFTPERLTVTIIATLLTLPFWLVFELLLRRGAMVTSTLLSSLGRVAILLLMAIGVWMRVIPFVVMLILPSLAILFVMIEIFAASIYSVSRNLVLIAIVEAAWFAWIMAATSPITFMF
jgi:dienelactone hydrolase